MNKTLNKTLLASALTLALGTVAQQAAAADVYTLDNHHTYAMFEINHLGFSTLRGGFTGIDGDLSLDLAAKTGSVNITIDANSLQTAVPDFTTHLKSADFFEVEKYPTLTFKSTAFKFEGEQLSKVEGDLTMHGVTQPITLDVTAFRCGEHPMKKKPHCGADAQAVIKRSDWGISTYVPHVADEVTLKIEIEATR